jgi:hypothetical protein
MSYVFRTLPDRLSVFAVALALCAVSLAAAEATTLVPSQTFKAGTRIACVLDETINSATAKYGDKFKLRIVDTSHPALAGGHITGWVTEVRQPSGVNRAMIRFFLTSIHLANRSHKPISAFVISKRVTNYDPGELRAARNQLPPAMAAGMVTPGPVAWQMNFGGGNAPSVQNRGSGTLGGTIYAQGSNEPIVIPSGAPVTVELQQPLTIP